MRLESIRAQPPAVDDIRQELRIVYKNICQASFMSHNYLYISSVEESHPVRDNRKRLVSDPMFISESPRRKNEHFIHWLWFQSKEKIMNKIFRPFIL